MTPAADSFAEATVTEAPFFGDFSPGLADRSVPAGRLAAALRHRVKAGLADRAGRVRGLPMVEAASVLWARFHKYDAADPRWPDRDRFVSCDSGGALLHAALLALSGHACPGEGSTLPHPAVEVASGPSGQGLGHAVGLALAERLLAARFGRSLVDHRTWVMASEGDLVGGLGHEAASLAGHLRLGRLTVLWATEHDGPGQPAATDDALRRFAGYGWTVRRLAGPAPVAIAAALALAVRSSKPTLLACGAGGPDAPTEATDAPEVLAAWAAAGARGSTPRRAWLKRLARHTLREEFERVTQARLPDGLRDALATLRASFAASRPAMATRSASESVLEAVAPSLPELVGGSADLAVPATGHFAAHLQGTPLRSGAARPAGRFVPWAMREHGMAATVNGLALHGGLIPYGGAFVVASDYMRPALRLAALMRQRVIHVLTRDGGDRTEDGSEEGPTHQAVEQLASLRAVPNLYVFRPADAIETAECWEVALRRHDGPSLLALSRQPVPSLRLPGPAGENRVAQGGYLLADAEGGRQATLIATGPEVATAMAARELLRAEGVRVAVVSLPCWELFDLLGEAEREAVLGAAPRVGIEAAGEFGWARWLGPGGRFVGFCDPETDARASGSASQARPNVAGILAAVRPLLSRNA